MDLHLNQFQLPNKSIKINNATKYIGIIAKSFSTLVWLAFFILFTALNTEIKIIIATKIITPPIDAPITIAIFKGSVNFVVY